MPEFYTSTTHWNWEDNAQLPTGKAKAIFYFLEKLSSFNVCRETLQIFYHSVVVSLIVLQSAGAQAPELRDTNKLNTLIKNTGSVLKLANTNSGAVWSRKLCEVLSVTEDVLPSKI